jgi:hypothetical protein
MTSERISESWTTRPLDPGFTARVTVSGGTASYVADAPTPDARAQQAELAHLLASIDMKLDAAEHRMDALLARLGAA